VNLFDSIGSYGAQFSQLATSAGELVNTFKGGTKPMQDVSASQPTPAQGGNPTETVSVPWYKKPVVWIGAGVGVLVLAWLILRK